MLVTASVLRPEPGGQPLPLLGGRVRANRERPPIARRAAQRHVIASQLAPAGDEQADFVARQLRAFEGPPSPPFEGIRKNSWP